MSKTPKWTQWCTIYNALSHTREKVQKEQRHIINKVEEDMNLPGQDRTNEILEEETDLEKLIEIVQPLCNLIETTKNKVKGKQNVQS